MSPVLTTAAESIEILARFPTAQQRIELILKFATVGTTLDESGLPLERVDVCSIAAEAAGQITLFPWAKEIQGRHFRLAQEVTLGLLSRIWPRGMQKWGFVGNDPQSCWETYWAWVRRIPEFDDPRRDAIERSRLWAHRLVWSIWTDRRSLPAARQKVEFQTGTKLKAESESVADAEFLRELVNESVARHPRTPFFVGRDGKLRIGHRQASEFMVRGRERRPHLELDREPVSLDLCPTERVARVEHARRAREALAARQAGNSLSKASVIVLENFPALASGKTNFRELAERTGVARSTLHDAYKREKKALKRMIA